MTLQGIQGRQGTNTQLTSLNTSLPTAIAGISIVQNCGV